MSGSGFTGATGGPDEPDPPADATLAAEYVLGTLDPVEHAAAAHRAASDAAFAAEIAFWEARLAPLATLGAPMAPPATLWARIEDSIAGHPHATATPAQRPPRPANENTVWRYGTFAGFALAAGLALFILLTPGAPPPPPPAERIAPGPAIAVLTPYESNTQVVLAYESPDGSIAIRPNAAVKIPDGKDLELWQMPKGATKPASLGTVPTTGKTVPPGVVLGTTLLVSLEPKGGSPSGQPTGPVLFAGQLARVE